MTRFVAALLFELKKRFKNCQLIDLEDREFENVLEITKALRNLVQYQNILNTTIFDFEGNISLFCSILRQKDNDFNEVSDLRIKTIGSIIFDILKIISKNQKFSEYLISNQEFAMLVTLTLFIGEREIFDKEETKKMVSILHSLINYESLDIEKFLVKDGIVMFFLHVIFEKRLSHSMRFDIARLLK